MDSLILFPRGNKVQKLVSPFCIQVKGKSPNSSIQKHQSPHCFLPQLPILQCYPVVQIRLLDTFNYL